MFRNIVVIAAVAFPIAAIAQPAPFTVEQCINLYGGLNSLNCAGEQLNDPSSCKSDSKQYNLGAGRITVAVDLAALSPVVNGAQREQQGFVASLPPLPKAEPGKPDSADRLDATTDQTKQASVHWRSILDAACPVSPGHLKADDMKIGDGDGKNAFPPSVLGALAPLIDWQK